MHRVLLVSGLVLALAIPPAYAATTVQEVVSACAVANSAGAKASCRAAIQSYIASLGLTGTALDEALGQLAYALVTAPGLNATTGAVIGDALSAVADSITDTSLKASISTFAADAADGQVTPPANAPAPRNPSGA